MKKSIRSGIICGLVGLLSAQQASALIVFDPAAQGTRVIQLAKEVITGASTYATQINTFLQTNKLLVLDPIANGLIAASLLSQQKGTINLVTGGLGGSQPLLQSNPEQWIQNQGLNAVRVSLGDINNQGGIFSSSLLSSLIGTYKNSNNLTTQLQVLTKSSIPTLTQNSLCKDANLTAIAKNDVTKSDGTFNPTDLAKRKSDIYNALCRGNPQTDIALANRLLQVNSQRPDIAGWDSWLAITGGDNAYTKATQAQILVEQDRQKKEAAAQADLNRGGGIISPSKCTQTVSGADLLGIGTIANLPCKVSVITNSSAAVASNYSQALNAPIQKLIGAQGSGILGTLSTLLAAKNTFDMLSNAFGGVSGGSTNTSNTTNTNTATTQDLLNNPTGKSAISDPIFARLDAYASSTKDLQKSDSDLQSQLNIAQGSLATMRGCFQKIVDDFSLDPTDGRVANAFSYYGTKSAELASYGSTITQDQNQIDLANSTMTQLKSKIQSSNSTKEISDAYDAFEAKIGKTLPGDSAGIMRQKDVFDLQGYNQSATTEGGDLFNLNAQCTQVRQQLTPRDAP